MDGLISWNSSTVIVERDLLTIVTRVDTVVFSTIFGSSEGYRTKGSDGRSGVVWFGHCCTRDGGGCVLSFCRC